MASHDKYVIRPHRPFRCALWVVTLVIVAGFAQWFWYEHLSGKRSQLVIENEQLRQQLQDLHQRYLEINESHTGLHQAETMHQAKTEQLENRLEQLQQHVIDLNKELLFYQNITQGDSSSELQVRDMQLRIDTENPLLMRYRLVITQGENISEPITGTISVETLVDSEDGSEATRVSEHGLNLRHVQVVEGSFEVTAEAGLPAFVQIRLIRDDNTLTSRRFEAKALIAAGQ